MSIRTFFNLLLRIFGLLILKDGLRILYAPVEGFLMITNRGGYYSLVPFLISLVIAALYLALCYVLFFRTSLIIDRLGLAKGYDTDELYFGKNTPDILLISITVIGGYMVAAAIPGLITAIFDYIRSRSIVSSYASNSASLPPIGGLVEQCVTVITGLLIIGYRLQIANLWWAGEMRRTPELPHGGEDNDILKEH